MTVCLCSTACGNAFSPISPFLASSAHLLRYHPQWSLPWSSFKVAVTPTPSHLTMLAHCFKSSAGLRAGWGSCVRTKWPLAAVPVPLNINFCSFACLLPPSSLASFLSLAHAIITFSWKTRIKLFLCFTTSKSKEKKGNFLFVFTNFFLGFN